MHLLPGQVRSYADHAVSAQRQHRQCVAVIAAPDQKTRFGFLDYFCDLVHVPAGFFGTDNVWDFAQSDCRFRPQAGNRARGHIIKDAG